MQFPVPTLDLATLAVMVQWLTIIVAAAAMAWFATVLLKRGRRSLKGTGRAQTCSEPVLVQMTSDPVEVRNV